MFLDPYIKLPMLGSLRLKTKYKNIIFILSLISLALRPSLSLLISNRFVLTPKKKPMKNKNTEK